MQTLLEFTLESLIELLQGIGLLENITVKEVNWWVNQDEEHDFTDIDIVDLVSQNKVENDDFEDDPRKDYDGY